MREICQGWNRPYPGKTVPTPPGVQFTVCSLSEAGGPGPASSTRHRTLGAPCLDFQTWESWTLDRPNNGKPEAARLPSRGTD